MNDTRTILIVSNLAFAIILVGMIFHYEGLTQAVYFFGGIIVGIWSALAIHAGQKIASANASKK